jgi:hypothetical protein
MKIVWKISEDDKARVRGLITAHAENPLLIARRAINLAVFRPPIEKATFWQNMVGTRMTSRQKSSAGSPVYRLIESSPFAAAYNDMPRQLEAARTFLLSRLSSFEGIRDYDVASNQLSQNFIALEDREWEYSLEWCRVLAQLPVDDPARRNIEREAARYIAVTFKGFGPKQSRNFLQGLGITCYEILIDTRWAKWLNEIRFPVPVNRGLLANAQFYEFVLDALQSICNQCDIYPCLLDAAVFSENDYLDRSRLRP